MAMQTLIKKVVKGNDVKVDVEVVQSSEMGMQRKFSMKLDQLRLKRRSTKSTPSHHQQPQDQIQNSLAQTVASDNDATAPEKTSSAEMCTEDALQIGPHDRYECGANSNGGEGHIQEVMAPPGPASKLQDNPNGILKTPTTSSKQPPLAAHTADYESHSPKMMAPPAGPALESWDDPDGILETPTTASRSNETLLSARGVVQPNKPAIGRSAPEWIPEPCHPLVAEYRNHVLPNFKRMVDKYFSKGDERMAVDLHCQPAVSGQPNASNTKPVVVIMCKNKKKMRKAINRTECIDEEKFDVEIIRGDIIYPSDTRNSNPQRLRQQYHPTTDEKSGNKSNPERPTTLSQVAIYQCGLRIYPLLDNTPVGNTLVGGFIEVGERCYGLTVCHIFTSALQIRGELAPRFSHTESESSSLSSIQTASVDHDVAGEHAYTGPDELAGSPRWQLDTSCGSDKLSESGEATRIAVRGPTSNRESFDRPLVFKASGIRLTIPPGTDGNLRYVMDWALVDMGHEPRNQMPNSYTDTQIDSSGSPLLRRVTKTAHHGRKAVHLLIDGKVYCNGTTSGVPSLVSLQNKPDLGLAFMVSTDQILGETLH
jgi:hypothetical protein